MTFSPAELRILELSDAIDGKKTRRQLAYARCIQKKIERIGIVEFRRIKAEQVRQSYQRRKGQR